MGFIVPNRSFSPLAAGKKADHELTERNLLSKMRGLLPSHCIPDRVILVNHFPLTAHGEASYMHVHVYMCLHVHGLICACPYMYVESLIKGL